MLPEMALGADWCGVRVSDRVHWVTGLAKDETGPLESRMPDLMAVPGSAHAGAELHGCLAFDCPDFTVKANGTLNLLHAARRYAPDATFAHIHEQGLRRYGESPAPDRPRKRRDLTNQHPYLSWRV